MVAEIQEQNIKVHCRTHGVNFLFLRGSEIVCPLGHEALDRNFPYQEFWEYCCDCLYLSPINRDKEDEIEDKCQACGRRIARRYLCNYCHVLTFSSNENTEDSPFVLPVENIGPQPSCPGCSKISKAELAIHECRVISVSYATALERCPFCKEWLKTKANVPIFHAEPKGGQVLVEPSKESANSNSEVPPQPFPRLKALLSLKTRQWLKSREGVLGLIGIAGFILTAIGTLLAIFGFTPVYSRINWYIGTTFSGPPVLKAVESDKREITTGQHVMLKAVAGNNSDHNINFVWSCSAGLIEGTGADVRLNTSGITPQAVPFKVTVSARMVDDYGRSSDARELDIYVIPIGLLNNSPVLKTIKCNCNTQEVKTGEKVSLTAIAEDPDGDTLTYEWQSSTGQIEGTGSIVTLNTAGVRPETNFAPVKVTLTVKDGRGRSVSNDITVNVVPEQAPKTRDTAPPQQPQNNPPVLVVFQPDRTDVETGEPVKFQAIAKDPDNDKLIYEWDSSKGQIEGGGPAVTLNTSGIEPLRDSVRVIVTLTIRDGRGASAQGSLIITIIPRKPKAAEPVAPAVKATPLILLARTRLLNVTF